MIYRDRTIKKIEEIFSLALEIARNETQEDANEFMRAYANSIMPIYQCGFDYAMIIARTNLGNYCGYITDSETIEIMYQFYQVHPLIDLI